LEASLLTSTLSLLVIVALNLAWEFGELKERPKRPGVLKRSLKPGEQTPEKSPPWQPEPPVKDSGLNGKHPPASPEPVEAPTGVPEDAMEHLPAVPEPTTFGANPLDDEVYE